MTRFLSILAILTITTNAIAGENEDMVCKKTTTFETDDAGATVITTRTVCESE